MEPLKKIELPGIISYTGERPPDWIDYVITLTEICNNLIDHIEALENLWKYNFTEVPVEGKDTENRYSISELKDKSKSFHTANLVVISYSMNYLSRVVSGDDGIPKFIDWLDKGEV